MSITINLVFEMHLLVFLQGRVLVCNVVRTGICFCFLLPPRVPLRVFFLVILSSLHLWSCRDEIRRAHCKPSWISLVLVCFSTVPSGHSKCWRRKSNCELLFSAVQVNGCQCHSSDSRTQKEGMEPIHVRWTRKLHQRIQFHTTKTMQTMILKKKVN